MKNVTNTVKSNLYLLKRIRPFLSQTARMMFCNSYMVSHLDYLCTVWGNTTKENLKKLHRQQKHAARLIYDDWESKSSNLFEKLNWLPMESRIAQNKLILVYKALHSMCPQYFSALVKYQRNNVYNMRSVAQKKLSVPRPRCEIFKKSFSYSGPHLWNIVPHSIHKAESLQQFKKLSLQYILQNNFP